MIKVKEEVFEYRIDAVTNTCTKRLFKDSLKEIIERLPINKKVDKSELIEKAINQARIESKLSKSDTRFKASKADLELLELFDDINIDKEKFKNTVNLVFDINTTNGRENISNFFFNYTEKKYSYLLNRTVLENENMIFFKADDVICRYIKDEFPIEIKGSIKNITETYIEINTIIISINAIISIEKIESKENLYLLKNYEYIRCRDLDKLSIESNGPIFRQQILGGLLNEHQAFNLALGGGLVLVAIWISKFNVIMPLKLLVDVICISLIIVCVANAFIKINGYPFLYFLISKKYRNKQL